MHKTEMVHLVGRFDCLKVTQNEQGKLEVDENLRWTFIILTTVAVDGKSTALSFVSGVSQKRRLLALFLFTRDSNSSRSELSEKDSDTLENLERDMMLACLRVN